MSSFRRNVNARLRIKRLVEVWERDNQKYVFFSLAPPLQYQFSSQVFPKADRYFSGSWPGWREWDMLLIWILL
jgi:hypothetical protein